MIPFNEIFTNAPPLALALEVLLLTVGLLLVFKVLHWALPDLIELGKIVAGGTLIVWLVLHGATIQHGAEALNLPEVIQIAKDFVMGSSE